MTVEKPARIGQLELCCQHVSVDIELLRETAQKSSGTKKKCHEEDGEGSLANYKNHIISQMPKMKNITPCNWLRRLTTSTDEDRDEICWDVHTAGEHLMPYLENHFRKQNADRSKTSTEFLFAANPQVRPCERAPPYRLREVRTSKKEGSCQAASIKIKVDSQFISRSSTLWTATRTRSTRLTNTSSLSTAQSTLWTWMARRRRSSSSTKTLNGCAVCFDTIPRST